MSSLTFQKATDHTVTRQPRLFSIYINKTPSKISRERNSNPALGGHHFVSFLCRIVLLPWPVRLFSCSRDGQATPPFIQPFTFSLVHIHLPGGPVPRGETKGRLPKCDVAFTSEKMLNLTLIKKINTKTTMRNYFSSIS